MVLGLSLLGEIKVTLDGNPLINLSAEKTYALLIYLVVESDRAHRRENLAELLWPEKPEGYGRNSLKQALSQLRTAINDREKPEPYLISSNRDLQFNTQSTFQLDIHEYENLIRKARKHCPNDQVCCEDCSHLLEEASRFYRDDFLSDFYLADSVEFDEWILAKREAFRRLQVDTLNRLVKTFEADGDYSKACQYARELIRLEPWSENSHRELMRLLAASGKRSAALNQFHSCEEMLANEFEAKPTPQTRQLYETIKAWDQVSGQITPDFSKSSKHNPVSESQPRSGIRKWIILTASLCILILVGVIYIVIKPIGLFKNIPDPPRSAIDYNTEDSAPESPTKQPTSPPDNQEDEDQPGSGASALNLSGSEGEFVILPENACLKGEELLYLEDFQDGEAQGWPEIEYKAQEWTIESDPHKSGNLVLTRPSTYDGQADLRNIAFENAVWRFRILFPGNAVAKISWLCNDQPYFSEQGYVESSSYDTWFHYKDIQLFRITDPLPDVAIKWEDNILKKNIWHNIEISTYQGLFSFYVDGELFVEYLDPEPLPSGRIEIGVIPPAEPEDQVSVYFDDFIVCGLNSPFVSAYQNNP